MVLSVQHGQQIAVGQKCQRPVVHLREISADHERRAKHAPEAHHRLLLIFCERCHPFIVILELSADHTHGKHITVRIAARLHVIQPGLTAPEHRLEKLPAVPEVIRNAPHIGIVRILIGARQLRRSRGQRKHNRPPRLHDRPVDHPGFLPARERIVI